MAKIDYATVLDELTKIVESDPKAIRQCKYVEYDKYDDDGQYGADDSTPVAAHCIAGVWFHQRGVSLEDLASSEGVSAEAVAKLRLTETPLTQKAQNLLVGAQCHQDSGLPWTEALDRAVEDLALYHDNLSDE